MWPYDFDESDHWQMALGERAALEGVLAWLRPRLAIELGTAEGGSLERIAAHSDEVHSIDLRSSASVCLERVIFHRGDSHVLLPSLLARFASEGRNVDFVLVDGDKSAQGVERDLRDLLDSDAIQRTVVLLHDTMNEGVRAGFERIDLTAYGTVRYVDSDFVVLAQRPAPLEELWGGLGIIIVDARSSSAEQVVQRRTPASATTQTFAWRLATPVRRGLRWLRPLGRHLNESSGR